MSLPTNAFVMAYRLPEPCRPLPPIIAQPVTKAPVGHRSAVCLDGMVKRVAVVVIQPCTSPHGVFVEEELVRAVASAHLPLHGRLPLRLWLDAVRDVAETCRTTTLVVIGIGGRIWDVAPVGKFPAQVPHTALPGQHAGIRVLAVVVERDDHIL